MIIFGNHHRIPENNVIRCRIPHVLFVVLPFVFVACIFVCFVILDCELMFMRVLSVRIHVAFTVGLSLQRGLYLLLPHALWV